MAARDLLGELTAMKVALEWEREMKMTMELALQEKVVERSMLLANKERMLADNRIKENLIADFMVFMEAVQNNDVETAQKFDERGMMDAVVTAINGHGNYGGNAAGNDGN